MTQISPLIKRRYILVLGVFTMLFAGVLYAWSILKTPFAEILGYDSSELALNFTLTMSFFCLGGFLSSRLVRLIGVRCSMILSGTLAGVGYVATSFLGEGQSFLLFVTYALLAGLGIGMAYIIIISTVNAWFPDRRGLSSGALMMGFGASALILGNVADAMFKSSIGWRATYIALGAAILVVLSLAGILIGKPAPSVPKANNDQSAQESDREELTSRQMLCRPSFWMAFLCISFLAAVGSSVISFAKDIALSVNAPETLAVSLVGVLSVCNGIGRIITGAVFDVIGCRKTMICANIFTICAALVTLIAVMSSSLVLCIIGVCLTGISYGSCPTITSAFTSFFYGMKHFSSNMALMTFTVMVGSLIATASNKVLELSGGYTFTFVMLLALTFVALILNIFIKKK